MFSGGMLLILIRGVMDNDQTRKWIETILVSIIVKGPLSIEYVILFTYGSELFPSTIRGTAVGIAFNAGKFMSLFCVPIMVYCKDIGQNGVVGCVLTALIALPFMFKMPETLRAKLE